MSMKNIAFCSLPALVGVITSSQDVVDPDLRHIYHVLGDFLSKGQLVLETFPCLSLKASTSISLETLVALGFASRVALCMLATRWLCWTSERQAYLDQILSQMICCGALVFCHSLTSDVLWDAMQSCCSAAECALLFATLLATTYPVRSRFRVWSCEGFCDALVVVAWLLGCNFFDLVAVFFIVFQGRVLSFLQSHEVKNMSDSAVFVNLGLISARSILQPLVLWMAALGVLSPASEIAAGGNYNTRFLSPQARRALSPVSDRVMVPNVGNHSVPRQAVVPYFPVSLYLPMAGFLWQDDAVWLPGQGVFGNEEQLYEEEEEQYEEVEESPGRDGIALRRAYFSDPIARRHPWAFEQEMSTSEFETQDEDYIRSHLWAGERVFLRSRVTGLYLGLEGDQGSHIDEEMNVRPVPGDGFQRLRVGGLETRSANTTWIIEYDPRVDGGFRLMNPSQSCHLASSFRHYPDWDGEQGNDTVSVQLHSVVEATCTRAASRQASTFFIIEGLSQAQDAPLWPTWAQPAWDLLMRGHSVARGLLSLHNMRRLYGEVLEVPGVLMRRDAESSPNMRSLERALLGVFFLSHGLFLLWRKRFRRCPGKAEEQKTGRAEREHVVALSALFVYVHFAAYHLGGAGRPFGSRLVMVFALVGLGAISGTIGYELA